VPDDFVPSSDTINVISTSGVYLSTLPSEVDDTLGCRQRLVDPVPDPVDRIQIRIYEDGADDSYSSTVADLPGALLAERLASSTGAAWGRPNEGTVIRTEDSDGPNTLFFGTDELTDEDYQIDLSADPITGLMLDGRKYWIDITNRLSWEYECSWAINAGLDGNDHMAMDYVGGYYAFPSDLTFCLNTGFLEPAAPTGVCCGRPNGDCADGSTQLDCLIADGGWIMNDTCVSARDTGRCRVGGPPNDTCDTPLEIGPGKDIDADPAEVTITIPTFHKAATTSLPDVRLCADTTFPHDCLSGCDTEGGSFIGDDLWYSYVPPVDGNLVIDTCQVWFSWDSMLAIYRGPEGTGVCPCPTDTASCEESAFPDQWGETANDDGCTPFYWGGPAWLTRPLTAGTCYLIQVGSYRWSWPPAGDGYLSISFDNGMPPPLVQCDNDFPQTLDCDGAWPDSIGCRGERLPRFLCVQAPSPGSAAGGAVTGEITVTLKKLYNTSAGDPDGAQVCASRTLSPTALPSLSQFSGEVRYLGEPRRFVDEVAPIAVADYIAAPLVCNAADAWDGDWSSPGLAAKFTGGSVDTTRIYMYGDTVVPCSVYVPVMCVDAEDNGTCNTDNAPTILTAKHGDTWPPFAPTVGQPGFTDINAVVQKYKSNGFNPGSPTPPPNPSGAPAEWHALQFGNVVGNYPTAPTAGGDPNPLPAVKCGFLDIGSSVDAYKSIWYKPNGPCNPTTATDSCGNACDPAPGD
jgi:hypothetical protein